MTRSRTSNRAGGVRATALGLALSLGASAALAHPAVAGNRSMADAETMPPTAEAVAATTDAVAAAPALDLRVTQLSRSVGADGVERQTRYTNRLYRRPGMVWIERELPPQLTQSLEHGHTHARGPHAGHAHDEAQGAPLRVSRSNDGKESVEVVLRESRRVIAVDRAHHGNVGYAGSWDNAYWLVAPARLQRMTRVGAPQGGVQRYSVVQGEMTTRVDWDVQGQFPRRIERRDAHGASYQLLRAERVSAPRPAPWIAAEGYGRGDYSDLLD